MLDMLLNQRSDYTMPYGLLILLDSTDFYIKLANGKFTHITVQIYKLNRTTKLCMFTQLL